MGNTDNITYIRCLCTRYFCGIIVSQVNLKWIFCWSSVGSPSLLHIAAFVVPQAGPSRGQKVVISFVAANIYDWLMSTDFCWNDHEILCLTKCSWEDKVHRSHRTLSVIKSKVSLWCRVFCAAYCYQLLPLFANYCCSCIAVIPRYHISVSIWGFRFNHRRGTVYHMRNAVTKEHVTLLEELWFSSFNRSVLHSVVDEVFTCTVYYVWTDRKSVV